MILKMCTKCNETREIKLFSKDKKNKDGLTSCCKYCRRQYYVANKDYFDRKNREWHVNNPKKQRDNSLKRLYGITALEYDNMLDEQKGKCKICKTETPGGNKKHLSVDHCHTTGKIRGLLCDHCNRGLGYFKDDVDILKKSIEYLLSRQE